MPNLLVCPIIIARPRWSGTSPVGRQLPSGPVVGPYFYLVSSKLPLMLFTMDLSPLWWAMTVCNRGSRGWMRCTFLPDSVESALECWIVAGHISPNFNHVFLSWFDWFTQWWRWKRLGYWQYLQSSFVHSVLPSTPQWLGQQILQDGIAHVCGTSTVGFAFDWNWLLNLSYTYTRIILVVFFVLTCKTKRNFLFEFPRP